MSENGWKESASAWIVDMGEFGDFGRRYVLDPVMLPLALARAPKTAIDVGCGEGRFCRALAASGIAVTGIDLTAALLERARERDATGTYIEASAEHLPFEDASFDLAVCYLSLIDIPDYVAGIREAARVLKPGGAFLIANLNSFTTAAGDGGWIRGARGEKLHFPIDNYLQDSAFWTAWRGIRIINHHRPMSAYMRALLEQGLLLTHYDEPAPTPDAPRDRATDYVRAPWFCVMEWLKPS